MGVDYKMSRTTKKADKNKFNKFLGYVFTVFTIVAVLLYGTDEMKDILTEVLGLEEKNEVLVDTHIKKQDSDVIEKGRSGFTDEELSITEGYIEYGELDELGRVTTANAVITGDMYQTGTSAKQSIKPTGWVSGKEPVGHARGHLIGNQLGGRGDDERNLVTIYQNPVNTPNMVKYENMIKNAILEGDIVRYRVTPIFEGDELFVKELHLEAKSITDSGDIDFYVIIPNEKD